MISNFIAMFGNAVQSSSEGAGATNGAGFGSLLPMIIIFAALILLMIIPQRKKDKQVKKMLGSLKKGDRIETTGGIRGVISSVKDSTVVVKVASGVKIEFAKDAIRTVLSATSAPATQSSSSNSDVALNIKPIRKGESEEKKEEIEIETPETKESDEK